MPDQPADPIHYEMKIPPEPRDTDDPSSTEGKSGADAGKPEGTHGEQGGEKTEDEQR